MDLFQNSGLDVDYVGVHSFSVSLVGVHSFSVRLCWSSQL